MDEFLALAFAKSSTLYNARQYQDMLASQYALISPNNYFSLASQTFDLVTNAQEPVNYKKFSNYYSSLSNTSQPFYTLANDEIFSIVHVQLYHFTVQQIEDLERQLNRTIRYYFQTHENAFNATPFN